VGWSCRLDILQSDLVIAKDHRFPPQLTDILGQVIDKGVVVVDNEDHRASVMAILESTSLEGFYKTAAAVLINPLYPPILGDKNGE
jgi:hypothetical protein